MIPKSFRKKITAGQAAVRRMLPALVFAPANVQPPDAVPPAPIHLVARP